MDRIKSEFEIEKKCENCKKLLLIIEELREEIKFLKRENEEIKERVKVYEHLIEYYKEVYKQLFLFLIILVEVILYQVNSYLSSNDVKTKIAGVEK